MKISPFIYKSKILIRVWFIFACVWLFITLFQTISGYHRTGYSSLFQGSETSTETFFAVFCLIFFSGWWIAEAVQCYKLLQEYKEFIKSLEKNLAVREILYRIKLSLSIIIIGLCLSILAGAMNHFNWIVLVALFALKFYYVYQCKQLINVVGVELIPIPKRNNAFPKT